jgi:probable HAF family extracellular repeat protein
MRGTRRWGVAVAMSMAAVAAPPGAGASTGQVGQLPGGLRITVTELTDQNGRPLVAADRINGRGQVLGAVETEAGRRLVVLHRGRSTPIGPDGFLYGHVPDISDRGQVAGTLADPSTNTPRAFSYSDVRGFEWLESPDDYRTSSARAVNDRGQVIGSRAGPSRADVVVWQRDGSVSVLPAVPQGSSPIEINNRGQALVAAIRGQTLVSMLWPIGGAPADLGSLAGPEASVHGMDLNDRGQAAGQGQTADGAVHAFLWSGGEMTDLGTLGGRHSQTFVTPFDGARVLNERGHVVGYSDTADGRSAAFLWRDGRMIELASPHHDNSWPAAINDRDQVVGNSAYVMTRQMAWLWQDGQLVDLGALIGDGHAIVRDINNRGQIVGTYDGRAVMWTVRRGG